MDITFYTIYGIRIPYNRDLAEAEDQLYSQLVRDGGVGTAAITKDNYVDVVFGQSEIYLGVVLYKQDLSTPQYIKSDSYSELKSFTTLKKDETEYKQLFKKLYPDFKDLVDKKRFKLFNVIVTI